MIYPLVLGFKQIKRDRIVKDRKEKGPALQGRTLWSKWHAESTSRLEKNCIVAVTEAGRWTLQEGGSSMEM